MIIILLGPPGSGKGTQANFIQNKLSIPHLSTGDILRKEISRGSNLGNKAKSFIDRGHLVPDNELLNIMSKRLNEKDVKKGFLLDGYPRTIPQAQGLDVFLHQKNQKIDTADH